MGGEHSGVNSDVGSTGRVTITEAAALLGVHPNTVRGRIKAGIYDAEKVATEHGLTWMIDPDSLVNEPPPKDSQQVPFQQVNPDSVTPVELVQDLLRPFVEDLGKVREELGAERVRREQAERERDELHTRLEALQAPATDVGAPDGVASRPATTGPQVGVGEPEEALDATETGAEASEGAEPRSDTVGPQTGAQEPEETARRPWWVRLFGG